MKLSGGRSQHAAAWQGSIPAELIQQWLGLEPLLRAVTATTDSKSLFIFLARGRQLFEGLRMEVKQSLRETLADVEAANVLPPTLLEATRAFVEQVSAKTDADDRAHPDE